ncbi:hypothetical protein FIBSPDRAFT_249168 [Athelia psychrophila]|uniref:Uncharacterized protein n=1 Tax=Athelia psychrophila TaxID=1759441 RepID=A0A165XYX9_9AGAM|nr:hypothetical protein FIBSPDRAFT_249168 [Fibularhizoctonia sp. CBS 109695]
MEARHTMNGNVVSMHALCIFLGYTVVLHILYPLQITTNGDHLSDIRSEARVSHVFLISVVLARWSCAEDPRAPLSVLPSNFGFSASVL